MISKNNKNSVLRNNRKYFPIIIFKKLNSHIMKKKY